MKSVPCAGRQELVYCKEKGEKKGMLKCVVFDMDGTLLDTERLAVQFWVDMAEEYGVEIPRDFIIGNCGRPRGDIVRRFQEHYPTLPVEEAMEHRDEWWLEQTAKGLIHTKPGAEELLTHLKEKEIRAVIATSTVHERAVKELTELGLFPYLDGVVSGDMMPPGRGKPNPDIFLLAMEKAGFPPEECMVVEDSASGCEGGIASGAKTVMIPDQLQPSEELKQRLYLCLDRLSDLIPVVDKLAEEE